MTPPVLLIEGITGGYRDLVIIKDVTITVPAGAVVAIVGPNGAGKSTLLRAVYGQATVSSGRVTFSHDGQNVDVTRWPSHRLTALGMNFVPQLDNVFTSLTVAENLEIGAGIRRRDLAAALARVHDVFPVLYDKRRQRAGTLSGGNGRCWHWPGR